MPKSIANMSLLSVTSAIAILCASCGASKVAQCNSMVKVANQAVTVGQEFANSAKNNKDAGAASKAFTTAAGKIEKLGQEMQALEIKDEKLQGLKTRFVKMYQDTNKGLSDTAKAIEAKNAPAMNKALVTIKAGGSQESTLVSEVNSYCSGK
jgi:predicted  nucleic acid-binding Zn-ribbon protein